MKSHKHFSVNYFAKIDCSSTLLKKAQWHVKMINMGREGYLTLCSTPHGEIDSWIHESVLSSDIALGEICPPMKSISMAYCFLGSRNPYNGVRAPQSTASVRYAVDYPLFFYIAAYSQNSCIARPFVCLYIQWIGWSPSKTNHWTLIE